jgi:peptide/nickel transport system permease protein
VSAATAEPLAQNHSRQRLRWPRFLAGPEGIVGLALLIFVLGLALIGPLIAPHSITAPIGLPGSGPGAGGSLGTDFLGRDVLSRVLNGGWPVLRLSLITTALIYALGLSVGMTAGFRRSLVDPVLMRTVDVFLSFPPMLLLLLLIAGAGTGTGVLVIGIVLVLFPGAARIARTATLEVCTTGYIEAAIGRGERSTAILRREVMPNIVPTMLADLGVRFSAAVVIAASVSFLGFGAKPPAANWGLMIAENRSIVSSNPWAVFVPAALLGVLTISVNLLADAYVRSLRRGRGR